jgi:signal transduction histidine kinase
LYLYFVLRPHRLCCLHAQVAVREAVETMESIMDTVRNARRILDDVLSLNKMVRHVADSPPKPHSQECQRVTAARVRLVQDQGMFEYIMRPALLGGVIDEAVGAHELQAAAAGVRITVACDASLRSTHLLMDAGRVGQVITNFLSNAIKFSVVGSAIAVRAEVLPAAITAASGGAAAKYWDVRVAVRDAGRGMTPAELARLFQPYTQIRAADMQAGCVAHMHSRARAHVLLA